MGNCSSTSNCNPCGPDFNAINQLATKAGAYARQANAYSVDAANSAINADNAFIEFNALYLGAFAVAPTVDNEGDPLQVGALYWNSILNKLWAWNGTSWMPAVEGELYLGGFASAPTLDNEGNPLQLGNLYWNTVTNNLWAYDGVAWVRTNFNETTPFFTQFTTSGTARSLEVRMRQDISSVKDWGARGDNFTDDTLAIQNAINFSDQYVYFPPGTYIVTAPIIVERSLHIFGAGSQQSNIRVNHNGNGIVFQPAGAGVSNIFLNNAEISDIAVSRPASITTPADNIWIRQCNGFKARGVTSLNGSTCFRFTGGQLNSLLQCRAFAGNASITPASGSAYVVFERSILSGGGSQPCYTTTIDDFIGGSFPIILRDGIRVQSIDGLNLSNVYMAGASRAFMAFERASTSDAIAAVNISNCYFDCTPFLGVNTPSAIFVNHGIGGVVYGAGTLNISNCVIANNDAFNTTEALIKIYRYVSHFNMSNCYVANGGSPWGVEINDAIAGASTGKYKFTGNSFSNLSQASGGGAVYAKDVDMIALTGNTFNNTTTAAYQVLVDGTVNTVSAVGNITDGTATQIVTIPSGATVTRNRLLLNAGQTSTNIVQLSLPTAITGLPSGAMWNNAGVVNIVP
jgi:hypothetical protein